VNAQPKIPPDEIQFHGRRENELERRSRIAAGFVLLWELFSVLVGSVARVLQGKPSTAPVVTTMPINVSEATGRAKDEDLDPERDRASHQRWGMVFVLVAVFIAIAAGVGFLFAYWTNANNMLLGGSLAICFGLFGVSLVLYSHWLMAARQAIEPREEHGSSSADQEAVRKEFYAEHDFYRRSLLKWIALAATGVMAAMIVSVIRSLGRPPGPSLFTTVWTRGQSLTTMAGTPVTVNALQPGNFIIVFPEDSIGDEKAQTVLIRVQEKDLQLPSERANWAPMGYVAYSRVCTHAGCSVGMFERTTGQLMCPCHQSTFDVLRAAQPSGGPAARPLPQLPLYADADGTLRAGGGFSEPPGPGFWEMP
jgi:ubiquinol-cytochrome c reductase iron-sulfur subunit